MSISFDFTPEIVEREANVAARPASLVHYPDSEPGKARFPHGRRQRPEL
jgi:hypothetical protein